MILYQARHVLLLSRFGKCTLFSRPFPARFHVFSLSYDPANTLRFTKYSNCLSLVIANLPTFIGKTSKTSLTSLSHCILDLHPSLFPSTFPSALATKNSNQYSQLTGCSSPNFFQACFLRCCTELQQKIRPDKSQYMYPSYNVNSLLIFQEIPSQTLTGVISHTAETTKRLILNANSHLSHLKFSWNDRLILHL